MNPNSERDMAQRSNIYYIFSPAISYTCHKTNCKKKLHRFRAIPAGKVTGSQVGRRKGVDEEVINSESEDFLCSTVR